MVLFVRLTTSFVLSFVLVLTSALPVVALDDPSACGDDFRSAVFGTPYCDPNFVATAVCAEGSTVVDLSGNNNIEKAFNFLQGKRLKPFQAAGIVGNLMAESGVDPTIHQNNKNLGPEPVHGTGFGIAQWTYRERQKPLQQHAKAKNLPTNSLEAQLSFLWHELSTDYKKALAEIKNSTTIKDATIAFMVKFEGPKDQSAAAKASRVALANPILEKYGDKYAVVDGVVGDIEASSPENCDMGGPGNPVSADGFTFPLVTTQKKIINHKPYPWCHKKQSSCHHDYIAADIMAATGTVVVAAKDGKVMTVKDGNQHPNNATIKGDDDKNLYYYTHMGANTLRVKVGQTVKANTPIGKVGTTKDAMGTDPHLHFDILPPKFNSRPGCTAGGCSSLPFIDPQPALLKTFKLLPEG